MYSRAFLIDKCHRGILITHGPDSFTEWFITRGAIKFITLCVRMIATAPCERNGTENSRQSTLFTAQLTERERERETERVCVYHCEFDIGRGISV